MSDTSQRGTPVDGEQLPENVRSKEAFPERPEASSPNAGGKASTAPEVQSKQCTTDTIDDGDGNYLEPPD